MAGSSSEEESGISRSLEGISLSGEPEWRSSEQVENGIASTVDTDDCGPEPAELYGKYIWKIDKFSQINKREFRSNAYEVGGYQWYTLIYPQGCDVNNHLSLFLCVANHDKLLPGWSHLAQFTIAVVNKDPKKSKYSDSIHRFWKEEHDWGWKKFIELSKLVDGFLDADTLIIKVQVQVIRERVDRPFRCLDCQYRRELVRVYLSNVEQICRRFVEEMRGRLVKLMEDKVRWSSFRTFWLGMDQTARRDMTREKSDSILAVVVKNFFIEKEVSSTLVMDSLYSGLKALETGKCLDAEEVSTIPIVRVEKDAFILVDDDVLLLLERAAALEPLAPKDEEVPTIPIVRVEKDAFILVDDDVLLLLERAAALEPLAPKDEEVPTIPIVRVEKDEFILVDDDDVLLLLERAAALEPLAPKDEEDPQNHTKDGEEDFSKDSIERDERRLTELGRRTIEISALVHIFSKIEVAYQEAVALKSQE